MYIKMYKFRGLSTPTKRTKLYPPRIFQRLRYLFHRQIILILLISHDLIFAVLVYKGLKMYNIKQCNEPDTLPLVHVHDKSLLSLIHAL